MDLITTHPNADFDGLASMVGLSRFYPGAVLAFSGSAESEVRDYLARECPIDVQSPRQVDTAAITRVVLCDLNAPERAGHFAGLARALPLHIYDHHPPEQKERPPEHCVIAPVGATTTLVTERLMAEGAALAPWEATLLALGIYEETGSLTHATTTPRDLTCAAWLLAQGADLSRVREYLSHELTVGQLELLDQLAHAMEIRYIDGFKVGVAQTHAAGYIPEVAGIAQRLLTMFPMDALVMLVGMEDKVVLVGRGTAPEIDVGRIAHHFGGGGHPTAASATLRGQTLHEASDAVWQVVDRLILPLRRARDIMTPNPVTLDIGADVAGSETILTRYGINALPVLEGGRLAGVITREAVQKALSHRMGNLPVTDLMDADPYTVLPDTPFREIRERMIADNHRFVPVVEEGTVVVGCITRTDLLRALHRDLQREETAPATRAPHQRNIRHLLEHRLPDGVLRLLVEIGASGERLGMPVYIVGGIVRDLLMGRENLDIDLVVEGDAIRLAEGLGTPGDTRVHVHERFGTATVVFERAGLPPDFKVDLATTRTEFYAYPSALPTVEQSSLKKDLYRRDFTINALAVDLAPDRFGMLIDFFGGQRDIKDGQIRVLHTLSFMDDPTRAIRAVRFATRFGFSIGRQTERLIRNAGRLELFSRLSGKRLLNELILLFSDADPVRATAELERLGILTGIDPAFGDGGRMLPFMERTQAALAWYRLQFFPQPILAWQIHLLGMTEALPRERRAAFWERLDLPGTLQKIWNKWQDLPAQAVRELAGETPPTPAAIYRCLCGAPPEILVHLMAQAAAEPVEKAVSLYLSKLADVRPLVNGDDLQALGVPPGPRYRTILDALLDARLNGVVQDREDELRWLRAAGYLTERSSGSPGSPAAG